MDRREDLSVESALDDFVTRASEMEEQFFVEPDLPQVEDFTEIVEPYVEEPQPRVEAAISQRTLVLSMMGAAAVSALAVVVLMHPAAPGPAAAAPAPRPRIEVTLPRVERPKPIVTELAPPPPPPVAHARALHKKRVLTAKVSRRSWSSNFAD